MNICLCYFSGTGMTEYVVNRLVRELECRSATVDCFRIESVPAGGIDMSGYEAFGIAYPVHSFNAPEIVINFAKTLPAADKTDTFIINTAGEENKINFASSDLLIRKLNKKGYRVFYNKLIEMPSNFIVKHDYGTVRKLLDKANELVPQIAEDIVALTPYSMKKIFLAKFLAFIGRAEWPGARILGKSFYAKNGCTRCGWCIDNCPNRNIEMDEKSVRFKWRCGLCMKCVYFCPENAVDIRQPYKFTRFKEWYDPELFKR